MKTIFVAVSLLVFALFISRTAYADLQNGGFETGDFSGWTLTDGTGSHAENNSWDDVVHSYSGLHSGEYLPKEGSYFSWLKAYGVNSSSLQYVQGPDSAPTLLTQNFSINAGESISGWAAFLSNDNIAFYNDYSYVRIKNVSNDSVIATPWYATVSRIGNYTDGPWESWSWTASQSGTYKFEFNIVNQGDNDVAFSSVALLDGITVTPEPVSSSLFLLGLGILGKKVLKRTKSL